MIRELYPEARVIACVRDVAWIIDSFERLALKDPLGFSRIYGTPRQRATVDSRAEALTSRERLVGFAWSAVKEAYFGPHAEALLLVETSRSTRVCRCRPPSSSANGPSSSTRPTHSR